MGASLAVAWPWPNKNFQVDKNVQLGIRGLKWKNQKRSYINISITDLIRIRQRKQQIEEYEFLRHIFCRVNISFQ